MFRSKQEDGLVYRVSLNGSSDWGAFGHQSYDWATICFQQCSFPTVARSSALAIGSRGFHGPRTRSVDGQAKNTSSRGLLPGSTLGKAGLPACRNRYAIEIQDFLAEHPGDLALDIVHQICVRAARADSSMTPQIVDEASRHHSQHRSLSLGSSFSFGFALILSSFPSLVRPRLGYHISCLLFALPFG